MRAVVFPGQGSQTKGIGADLFSRFPALVRTADSILGYSIRDLCTDDKRSELTKTEFAQPAIFVTSVLGYLGAGWQPDCVAGHSVGEYAALVAAQVFDFATGLRIVQQRGRLMAQAGGGGLAAVVGTSLDEVERTIALSGLTGIEIANINSPAQVVVGGPEEALCQFIAFCDGCKLRAVPLRVSGAFHTTMMRPAAAEFRAFLAGIAFQPPQIPVIANLTAEPHEAGAMADILSRHICSPVLWSRSIERMLQMGIETFSETGSAQILIPMIDSIRAAPVAATQQATARKIPAIVAEQSFTEVFRCAAPLVAGALGYGASGGKLTSTLASGGILAILDTDDVDTQTISQALGELSGNPSVRDRFGAALTARPEDPRREEMLVDLFLQHGVSCVEVRGFLEPSAALLRYRAHSGLSSSGRPVNHVIARIDDAAALDHFLCPASHLNGASGRDAFAVADALCIDSQSWRSPVEHPPNLLFQALGRRDLFHRAFPQAPRVFVGASDLAGSPTAMQALVSMGADFGMAGSVFLTAREAHLDAATKIALMGASYEHFQLAPDWWFPEFYTSSWSYIGDVDAADQSRALQALYDKSDIDPTALSEAMQQYAQGRRLLSEAFLSACETLDRRELRTRLRTQISATLFPKIIACDPSLAQFNAWMRREANPIPADRPALAIAGCLWPMQQQSERENICAR